MVMKVEDERFEITNDLDIVRMEGDIIQRHDFEVLNLVRKREFASEVRYFVQQRPLMLPADRKIRYVKWSIIIVTYVRRYEISCRAGYSRATHHILD